MWVRRTPPPKPTRQRQRSASKRLSHFAKPPEGRANLRQRTSPETSPFAFAPRLPLTLTHCIAIQLGSASPRSRAWAYLYVVVRPRRGHQNDETTETRNDTRRLHPRLLLDALRLSNRSGSRSGICEHFAITVM